MFKNLYNEIDFFFRKNIRLKRKYTGKNEPKEKLFENFLCKKRQLAEEKEKFYFEKYHLQEFKDNSTCRNYLENLAVIELLESCFNKEFLAPLLPENNKNSVKILDIGSKNWFYASGEWSFFKYSPLCHCEELATKQSTYCSMDNGLSPCFARNNDRIIYLDGIEIDAFRVYSDFHTRWDYAQFYIKNLENTQYIAKDFLCHNGKYDYIIWFFPFVTEFPLQEWGLPLSKFKPAEMLKHAYDSLNPGGKILIVNQDEKEYVIQEDLLKDLNLHYKKKGDFKNSFLEYEHKRFVTVIFGI
ncbi:MAG TPA: hypothetical protein DDW90_06370 [Cyanobacteria bacterium UBA9971]|nr:hypothetical protein [Cyanobacteria bacterium UBA9971]